MINIKTNKPSIGPSFMHIGGILPSVGKVSQELLKVAPETPIQYIIAMECNAQGKKDEIYTQQNKF